MENNKNIFFYFRLILCISLVVFWVLWLANMSEDKRSTGIKDKRSITSDFSNNKEVGIKGNNIKNIKQQTKKITQSKIKAPNFPSLIDLTPINEQKKDGTIKSNTTKVIIPLKETLPSKSVDSKPTLRKKVYVDKSQHKPILKKVIKARENNELEDTRAIESWLPN